LRKNVKIVHLVLKLFYSFPLCRFDVSSNVTMSPGIAVVQTSRFISKLHTPIISTDETTHVTHIRAMRTTFFSGAPKTPPISFYRRVARYTTLKSNYRAPSSPLFAPTNILWFPDKPNRITDARRSE